MSGADAKALSAGSPDGATAYRTALRPPAFKTLRIIAALILREMGSAYGRSPGGYIWALLSPIGTILILSMAFSYLVRAPSLGTSFILFYATGFLPFNLYAELSNKVTMSLRYSRALLAYPGVSWLHAVLARFILNTLTALTVFCMVIIGIMQVVETRTILDIRPILTGLAIMAMTALGVGLLNCLLMGLFQVWERIWGILSRPLFLVSGIFFLYDDMPRFAQDILWWNPLIHGIGLVRTGFYPTYHASYISLPYAFGVSLILIAAGLLFMGRNYRTVLEQ